MTDMAGVQPVNWIHPKLLEQVMEWCPDNVKQINSYTYEIFDTTFIVPGELSSVGAMIGFLMDNGWKDN